MVRKITPLTRNIEELSIGDYILSGGEVAAIVILDSILRFLGFTLLGYLVNKWEELWPKLLGLINILKPIIGTIQVIGQAIFNGIGTWISRGYMIYDKKYYLCIKKDPR